MRIPIHAQICDGDKVTVWLTPGRFIDGKVVYQATTTGDCWVIETQEAIHYVQNFIEIVKHKPK